MAVWQRGGGLERNNKQAPSNSSTNNKGEKKSVKQLAHWCEKDTIILEFVSRINESE